MHSAAGVTAAPSEPGNSLQGWAGGAGRGQSSKGSWGVLPAAQDNSWFSPTLRQEIKFKHRKVGPAHISSATNGEPHEKVTWQESQWRSQLASLHYHPCPPTSTPWEGGRAQAPRHQEVLKVKGPKDNTLPSSSFPSLSSGPEDEGRRQMPQGAELRGQSRDPARGGEYPATLTGEAWASWGLQHGEAAHTRGTIRAWSRAHQGYKPRVSPRTKNRSEEEIWVHVAR